MASTSIIAPSSKFSYFSLKTVGSENGGYSSSFENNGRMYIGQATTAGENAGVNCGSFGIILYDIPNKDQITSITSIDFSIFTTNNTSGYNGCIARIEYIGTSYDSYPGIWRVGSSSDQISLEENATTHLTTNDATTCSNFLSLIQSAISGQYYYFRIVRESEQGAQLNTDITLTITYGSGNQRTSQAYVWTTARSLLNYPENAMTSNTSQSCIATASSVYSSSYPIWRAFDKSTTTVPWASSRNETNAWIQLQMPSALYDIAITITNRNDRADNIRGPIAGIILGSNDGSNFTQIGSFSDRDGSTRAASSTITCYNSTVGYSYVKVQMSDWYPSGSHTYCAIGELGISGYTNPSTGGWVKVTPYVWTIGTIELPRGAMTSNESQGCIASSSSDYDSNQQAFRAFNKSISSSDYCWASANSDTSPWIQITLPQKLYNIELEIHNRYDYNNATGITDAIIYGSNDGGVTLTQIGTISGRSAAFQAMSIETCNNATVGYSTIKLDITRHGGTGAVTVGEIYIRGTGGGWVQASPYVFI